MGRSQAPAAFSKGSRLTTTAQPGPGVTMFHEAKAAPRVSQ